MVVVPEKATLFPCAQFVCVPMPIFHPCRQNQGDTDSWVMPCCYLDCGWHKEGWPWKSLEGMVRAYTAYQQVQSTAMGRMCAMRVYTYPATFPLFAVHTVKSGWSNPGILAYSSCIHKFMHVGQLLYRKGLLLVCMCTSGKCCWCCQWCLFLWKPFSLVATLQ